MYTYETVVVNSQIKVGPSEELLCLRFRVQKCVIYIHL